MNKRFFRYCVECGKPTNGKNSCEYCLTDVDFNFEFSGKFYCSECDFPSDLDFKYCYNCGA